MPTSLSACDVHVWSLFRFRFSSYWFFLKLRVRSSALCSVWSNYVSKPSLDFHCSCRMGNKWKKLSKYHLFRAISFEKEHLPVFVMFGYSRHKEGMKFVQNLDRTKNASIDTSESSSVRVRGNRDIQTTLHKSSLSFQQTEYFIAWISQVLGVLSLSQ